MIAGQAGRFETALEAVHEAKKRFADAKLAIWGEAASSDDVSAAVRAGADGVLSSTLSSSLVGHSLQLVLLGHTMFPMLPVQKPEEKQGMLNEPAPLPAPSLRPWSYLEHDVADHPPAAMSCVIRLEDHVSPSRPQELPANSVWSKGRTGFRGAIRSVASSDRKCGILRCLSSGKSNEAIAREVNIANTTVEVHIKSLLRKILVLTARKRPFGRSTMATAWGLLLIPALLLGK